MDKILAPSEIFKLYQNGIDYNKNINYYTDIELCENFFIGNQWVGLDAPNAAKTVHNVINRSISHQIAFLVSESIAALVTPNELATPEQKILCEALTAEFKNLIDKTMLIHLMKEALRDAAVDGDGYLYAYYDENIKTGQTAKGAITIQLIDPINVIFGNPAVGEVNEQPYVIIAKRQYVKDVQDEARIQGMTEDTISQIAADAEDRRSETDDNTSTTKCTVLLYLYYNKETGTIWAQKVVANAVVRTEWDLGYAKYPIRHLIWKAKKNTYHGVSEVKSQIPNQVVINKMLTGAAKALNDFAYPKVLYNKAAFPDGFSNKSGAIGVVGNDFENLYRIVEGKGFPPEVMQLIDAMINYTKEFMGTSDAALGEGRPENTSAIIALQKASAIPLEMVKLNLHRFIEELFLCIADMISVDYGLREVMLRNENDEEMRTTVNYDDLKDAVYSCRIDVGGGGYWNEIDQKSTAENLFKAQLIDGIELIKSIPRSSLPEKDAVIKRLKASNMQGVTQGMPQNMPTNANTMLSNAAGMKNIV